jgi:hypothetical protein
MKLSLEKTTEKQMSNISIGGFPRLFPSANKSRGIYYYNSARSCLFYLLKTLKPDTVLLPRYLCASFLDYAQNLDSQFEFYSIDKNFLPEIPRSSLKNRNCLIVYVNYFGVCSSQVKYVTDEFKNHKVVIDNSHSYKFEAEDAIATIYSPRKFFPISEGGLLFSDVKVETCPESSVSNLDHFEGCLKGDKNLAFEKFKENEKLLGLAGPLMLGEYSYRILTTFLSEKHLLSSRAVFFAKLEDRFGAQNLLSPMGGGTSPNYPLCYPLQTSFKLDVQQLIERRVFAPTYWPNIVDDQLNEFETGLKNQTCFLPLSNIKSHSHFKYLIDTVEDILMAGQS